MYYNKKGVILAQQKGRQLFSIKKVLFQKNVLCCTKNSRHIRIKRENFSTMQKGNYLTELQDAM